MKIYTAYNISSTSEIIIGLLSIYPFESFEERENSMVAYIPQDELSDEVKTEIEKVFSRMDVKYTTEVIHPKNWNALWESSFEPVVVDGFCAVRADFHDAIEGITHDIIINPKMAFGTGHHETTYMMMDTMSEMDFSQKSVFDYGCGTGVLAILASKLGSSYIDAIDIEEESYENTIENASINEVGNIHTACATLESFATKKYDIILANINRNVLLQSAEELYNRLNTGGILLISGILDEDEQLITDTYIKNRFEITSVKSKGYWKCIRLSPST